METKEKFQDYLENPVETFKNQIKISFIPKINEFFIQAITGYLYHPILATKYPVFLDVNIADFHFRKQSLNFSIFLLFTNPEALRAMADPTFSPRSTSFFFVKSGTFSLSSIENLKTFFLPFISTQLAEILKEIIHSNINKHKKIIIDFIRQKNLTF